MAALGAIGLVPAAIAAGSGPETPLDQLIEQFNAGAPEHDGVQIDGWVERGPEARRWS